MPSWLSSDRIGGRLHLPRNAFRLVQRGRVCPAAGIVCGVIPAPNEPLDQSPAPLRAASPIPSNRPRRLALFVALGGTSYAAGILIGTKQIKKNAVTTKKIRNGHVGSPDLKNNGVQSVDLADGGIELADLSGALKAQFGGLLDGSVTTAKLANGSVTSPKVAPNSLIAADLGVNSVGTSEVAPNSLSSADLGLNSVGSSEVASNSLTSGDLGASSVGGSEVAANSLTSGDIASGAIGSSELGTNSVRGDEVQNGSLHAVDVGRFSGSVGGNFGVIPSGDCGFVILDPTPGAENIQNSASLVTPGAGFSGDVSFHAEAEGGSLRLKACNVGGGPTDPDGLAGTSYNYIVFG